MNVRSRATTNTSPGDQPATLESVVAPMYQTYPPADLAFASWTDQPEHHGLPDASGMWLGNPSTMSYDTPTMFNQPPNGAEWPEYGVVPTTALWDPSASNSPVSGPYPPPVWPMSPEEVLSTSPWSPNSQPLQSPLSETPPYTFTGAQNDFRSGPFDSASPSAAGSFSGSFSQRNSSFDPAPSSVQADRTPKATEKGRSKPSKAPSKRATKQSDPKTKSRNHPKRKFEALSSAGSSGDNMNTNMKSSSKTLGGVLPPGVDPRVAAEQIKQEAWQRSKAEAIEMSQRRLMLLDHERGALERETQRLQVNIGSMREAIARQQAGLEDAVARAERLASSRPYSRESFQP